MEHPGWRAAREAAERRRKRNERALIRAEKPEDHESILASIFALSVPEVLAKRLLEAPRELETDPRLERNGARDRETRFTPETAQAAMDSARQVREMLALPGWLIIAREIATLMWAHQAILTRCPGADAGFNTRWIQALDRLLRLYESVLYAGDDAERWLLSQAKAEGEKGKEQADGR